MNKEELRQLTESYYYDVYDYETIDEANRSERAANLTSAERTSRRNKNFDKTNPDLRKDHPTHNTTDTRQILTYLARNHRGNVGGERLTGTTNRYAGYSGNAQNNQRSVPITVRGSGPVRFLSASRVTPTKKVAGGRQIGMAMAKGAFVNEESYDLYDVVLEHLLAEGYADDARSAEVIMANMSDEWLGDILEVRGFGGKVDPKTGEYDTEAKPTPAQQRHAQFGRTSHEQSREKRLNNLLPGDTRRSSVTSGGVGSHRFSTNADGYRREQGYGYTPRPEGPGPGLSMPPIQRAELAAKRAERQGQGRRANKIRSRMGI